MFLYSIEIVSLFISPGIIARENKENEEQINKKLNDKIKNLLEMKKPPKKKILSSLFTLQANDSLSKLEFFDIVGKIYQLNPLYFMFSIYRKLWSKSRKIYGVEGMKKMEKYIMENYCLNEGEQILYEWQGMIRQKVPKKYDWIWVGNLRQPGTIYITNERIIAHGALAVYPYESYFRTVITGGGGTKDPKKARKYYIQESGPCYGYNFPINDLHDLQMDKQKIIYFIGDSRIKINISKKEGNAIKIFEILEKQNLK